MPAAPGSWDVFPDTVRLRSGSGSRMTHFANPVEDGPYSGVAIFCKGEFPVARGTFGVVLTVWVRPVRCATRHRPKHRWGAVRELEKGYHD